jgi:hypothetical protein
VSLSLHVHALSLHGLVCFAPASSNSCDTPLLCYVMLSHASCSHWGM